MPASPPDPVLQEQMDYYRARAGEYDEWWQRQGRYDRGTADNQQWFADAEECAAALTSCQPLGQVLEVACGTGIWSSRLLPLASSLTVIDSSPEMLALHARRLGSSTVRYLEADLFRMDPPGRFDTVFFAFWLSHVPLDRFEAFWEWVRTCLAPGGQVFFIDSLHEPTSTAQDHTLPAPSTPTLTRRLNDGREYQIHKVFHDPASLTRRLNALGWRGSVQTTRRYFLHGCFRDSRE